MPDWRGRTRVRAGLSLFRDEETQMPVDPLQKQDRGPGDRLFRKGRSGKPAGRPPGSRNRATIAAEALLEGEAQALTRKAIELALEGDTTALRLCLERIVPQRKSRTVAFDTPRIDRVERSEERRVGKECRSRW